jgi:anti-sigma factor RsiW
LYCFDVLERLSDYLDGELGAPDRQCVEAHLAGCDECTRFGGEFGAVITALRDRLGHQASTSSSSDVPSEVARRLDESLDESLEK